MRQVQLVFANAADAWNFITETKVSNVQVTQTAVSGFLQEAEIERALKDFGAEVQDYVPEEAPEAATPAAPEQAAETTGQEIQLVGKSGTRYNGTIYAKEEAAALLPAHAIIGLTNSWQQEGQWQHAVNAFYRTDQVQQELDNFRSRDDLSHLIVIPANQAVQGPLDAVDDLIQSYIHQ